MWLTCAFELVLFAACATVQAQQEPVYGGYHTMEEGETREKVHSVS